MKFQKIQDPQQVPVDPAAQLAARRKRTAGKCQRCGTTWENSYVGRKFCSDTCRTLAYNERKAVKDAAAVELADAAVAASEEGPDAPLA